ncbi:MAG: c-type cytochrome [Edaphobacter sp.]
MNQFVRRSLLAACLVSLTAQLASAQDTPAATAQSARPPRGPRPNPTNLKVLPKTMTGDDVIKLMHQFTGDLGVECEFCHARNPETKRLDFASDANPVKNEARVMIRMTEDINTKYLTQIADHDSANAVTCGTCHRGMMMPETFVPKPRERGNHPPAPTTPPPAAN